MPLKQVNGNQVCTIRYDVQNRPTALMGLINVVSTKKRHSPPDCLSGFDTGYTFFDKGHLMALELGGPDISANIVPQYGQWQETGSWRQMERGFTQAANNGALFVVEAVYGARNADWATQQGRYQINEIFDWEDVRIPDSFKVWMIPVTDALVQDAKDNLLNIAADDNTFDNMMRGIKTSTVVPQVFDHSKMPDEDTSYWKLIQVGLATTTAWNEYETEYDKDMQEVEADISGRGLTQQETDDILRVTRSPRRDMVEFVMTSKETVGGFLIDQYGWSRGEVTALRGDQIMSSHFDNQRARVKKLQWGRHEDYIEAYRRQKLEREYMSRRGLPVDMTRGYLGTDTDVTPPR